MCVTPQAPTSIDGLGKQDPRPFRYGGVCGRSCDQLGELANYRELFVPVERASGHSPAQILENTLDFAGELTRRQAECFSGSVLPALEREGIEILRWKELEQSEQEQLQKLFRERIYPVLTPLVVDPAHPFPYISGLSLSLAVMIADPETGTTMFARVKVPRCCPGS